MLGYLWSFFSYEEEIKADEKTLRNRYLLLEQIKNHKFKEDNKKKEEPKFKEVDLMIELNKKLKKRRKRLRTNSESSQQ